MKCLVTGGYGFVGSVVVRKLRAFNHDVDVLDSLEPQVHGTLHRKLRAGERGVVQVYDAVVHLAAKVGVGQSMTDPVDYVKCNSLDTATLLADLTKVRPGRLVVASSMSVYGEGPTEWDTALRFNKHTMKVVPDRLIPRPVSERHPPDLHSIYALTKYDQEQLSLIWGAAYKIPTVALRFFNVYGPGQALSNPYTGVLAIFGCRLLNGKQPVIYEDGQQTRDFVHVTDVAEAVVQAATTDMPGGTYNVGTGIPRNIESVALDLASAMGSDLKPLITGQSRAGDIRHCYADNSKLVATGWEPRVNWKLGLLEYVEWLRRQPMPVDRFETVAQELTTAGLVK